MRTAVFALGILMMVLAGSDPGSPWQLLDTLIALVCVTWASIK